MSNSDSFIDEVTEELRRDQLNQMLSKYGWIAALVVVLAVGGAAMNEIFKTQRENAARAVGEAIDLAFREGDPAARATALAGIEGAQENLLIGFLEAAALTEAGRHNTAAERLEAVAEAAANDKTLRDLAIIRMAAAQAQAGINARVRQEALDPIIAANGVFALMALEQRAIGSIELADKDAAIQDLIRVYSDPQATPALRDRTGTLIVVLGGELPETGQLLDR